MPEPADPAQINEAIRQGRHQEREALLLLARLGCCRDNKGDLQHKIGRIAAIIAATLGLDAEFCDAIELAAPLNDIGKIVIPDAILLKEGALDPEETEVMRNHATLGYEMLKDSDSPCLQMAATIALYHHEMFNGEGYPHALQGEDIPIAARIVAVADVFTALVSKRPYREAMGMEEAFLEIQNLKGSSLDPACVEALLEKHAEVISCVNEQPQSQASFF
jgi:response regulator RpfG family c-di-GMP phosphodiesterase